TAPPTREPEPTAPPTREPEPTAPPTQEPEPTAPPTREPEREEAPAEPSDPAAPTGPPVGGPLQPPIIVAASHVGTVGTISWLPVEGATGYTVICEGASGTTVAGLSATFDCGAESTRVGVRAESPRGSSSVAWTSFGRG
ncbi:MAG TPA: hypothetical protein GXZ30_11770, partial [Propionibacterium sp.]|nr:hypothetical protein [Propionibacterium sp.]